MSAKDVLRAAWRAPKDATWHPVSVHRVVAGMSAKWGERRGTAPAPFLLNEVLDRVRDEWCRSGDICAIPRSDRRWLPYLLFYPPGVDGRWLSHDEKFRSAFVAGLAGEPRQLTSTAHVVLRDYPMHLSWFPRLLSEFAETLAADASFRTETWRKRHTASALFANDGPQRVAEQMLDSNVPLAEALESMGFTGELATCEFVRQVFRRLLAQVSELLSSRPSAKWLDRPLEFAAPNDNLRFPDEVEHLADALLVPHVETEPLADTKARIERFILRHLKDPRILPQMWQRVSDDARRVFLRWLVIGTLEDFFRLIEKSAWAQHWTYRRAFWEAYLKNDFIDDAWVVLGDEAKALALRVFRQSGSSVAWGTLTASDRNHSVLLLRIGGLTVAEWSHSGTCRIWESGNDDCPRLHQFHYTRDDLVRYADFEQVHHAKEQYTWQRKVAQYIGRETGRHVHQTDYRVRGDR